MTDSNRQIDKVKHLIHGFTTKLLHYERGHVTSGEINGELQKVYSALDALKLPTCETCSNGQFAYRNGIGEDWYKCDDDVIVDGTATHRWDFYCANHEPKEKKV